MLPRVESSIVPAAVAGSSSEEATKLDGETLVNARALGSEDLSQLPNSMDSLLLKLDFNKYYALRGGRS